MLPEELCDPMILEFSLEKLLHDFTLTARKNILQEDLLLNILRALLQGKLNHRAHSRCIFILTLVLNLTLHRLKHIQSHAWITQLSINRSRHGEHILESPSNYGIPDCPGVGQHQMRFLEESLRNETSHEAL